MNAVSKSFSDMFNTMKTTPGGFLLTVALGAVAGHLIFKGS